MIKRKIFQDVLILVFTSLIFLLAFVAVMEGLLYEPKSIYIKEELTLSSASMGTSGGYTAMVSGLLYNPTGEDIDVDSLSVVLSDGIKMEKCNFCVPARSSLSIQLTTMMSENASSVKSVTLTTGGSSLVLENPEFINPLSWLIPAVLVLALCFAWVHAVRVRLLMTKE